MVPTAPLGVRIVALAYAAAALAYGALAVAGVVRPSFVELLLRALTPAGSPGPSRLLALGSLVPAYFSIMAAVSSLLAWGMLRMQNWARLATATLAGLSLAVVVAGLLSTTTANADTFALTALRIVLPGSLVYYMVRPATRRLFAKTRPGREPVGSLANERLS